MKNKIKGFIKSEHFLLRQWQRKVDDELLSLVLNKRKFNKDICVLVISKKIVKKISKVNHELFILIRGNILVTCFYGEMRDFFNTKYDNHFEIIQ